MWHFLCPGWLLSVDCNVKIFFKIPMTLAEMFEKKGFH